MKHEFKPGELQRQNSTGCWVNVPAERFYLKLYTFMKDANVNNLTIHGYEYRLGQFKKALVVVNENTGEIILPEFDNTLYSAIISLSKATKSNRIQVGNAGFGGRELFSIREELQFTYEGDSQ